MTASKRYNLRVYALIVNANDEVLVSDERRNGHSFTKFPGGGMEWGEGTRDCLKRELREELSIDVEIDELFYVNDFFQISAFRASDQLISFYFFVRTFQGEIPATEHAVPAMQEGELFRWVKRTELTEELFTFPIDKIVGKQLSELTSLNQ